MASDASQLKNKNEVCVGPTSSQAGKASTCDGCPNKQECASGKFADAKAKQDEELRAIEASLDSVKNILLVLSGKGGVGKSTVASQIAWSLAHWGFKVGILDIDICGPSIARMMGVENENVRPTSTGWTPVYTSNGYDDDETDADDATGADDVSLAVMSIAFLLQTKNDAVIWRGPRKNGLIKQFLCDVSWGELDFLIIDSPPGTSDEHISIQKFLSGVAQRQKKVHSVIVSTPQEVSLLDVRKEITFCQKVKLPVLGIIENMSYYVCPCCNEKSEIFLATTGGVAKMCKDLNQQFLGSLPIDPLFLKCCDQGIGFLKYCEDYEDRNQSDVKMDDTESGAKDAKNKKSNANRQSLTYTSLVGVIDNVMRHISPATQQNIAKMRDEMNRKRSARAKPTNATKDVDMTR